MKRDEHIKYGALFAGARYVLERQQRNEPIDIGDLFIRIFSGAFGGRLADMIEPPLHPNHRGFYHSLCVGIITWVVRNKVERNDELNPLGKSFLVGACDGHCSHIAADTFTPKGTSLI